MADRRIKISAGDLSVFAGLNDTATADLVWEALPIEASGSTWGDEIRPASAVNVLGRIEGDATVLKQVRSGSKVRIERA